MNKHLNVLMHTGHMESPNLVALCVDKLDVSLPRFTSVQWDSVWATHAVSAEAYAWKTALGQGRTRPDFWSHHELLPLGVPSYPMCAVLSSLYPCKVDY
jgi:hypothetical protein